MWKRFTNRFYETLFHRVEDGAFTKVLALVLLHLRSFQPRWDFLLDVWFGVRVLADTFLLLEVILDVVSTLAKQPVAKKIVHIHHLEKEYKL